MRRPSVLFISSSGGHWVQLSRLIDAAEGFDVDVATVDPDVVRDVPARRVFLISDFNRDTPFKALYGVFGIASVVFRSGATHVISTGAAPGLVAIAIGRLLGKKTLWIDSIANAGKLSMSGRVAALISTATLSQWPDVAASSRSVHYRGRVV